MEFSHGELWSFHTANCGVFIRRIVEFSHGELWSFHPENCGVFTQRIVGNGRYSPHYTLPLHRITRVRLKTTKHTKHTKHHRSGIIWRAVAPFHEMMIFVSIRGSIHSCPFVSIRGSGFSFRVFRVFRGSTHSRPFVSIRGSVFSFRVFRVFRGSTHSCQFVVQSIRVHSCPFVVLDSFSVFRVFRGSTQPIRAHSWFLDRFQRKFFHEMLETTCFPWICSYNYCWRLNLIGKIFVDRNLFLVCLQQVVQHSTTPSPRNPYEEDIHPD